MSLDPGETRLRSALRRMRPPGVRSLPAGRCQPLDLRPTNPFEVAVAERLKALETELDQLRTRINWLLTVIVGAAVTNIVIALIS